jgi:hypothetical protein
MKMTQEEVEALERRQKLAQLGERVLEILKDSPFQEPPLLSITTAARSLGLLDAPGLKAKEPHCEPNEGMKP